MRAVRFKTEKPNQNLKNKAKVLLKSNDFRFCPQKNVSFKVKPSTQLITKNSFLYCILFGSNENRFKKNEFSKPDILKQVNKEIKNFFLNRNGGLRLKIN